MPRRVLVADNNVCNSLETMGLIKLLIFGIAGIQPASLTRNVCLFVLLS